ncbi:tetratricopeptide repeat-containing sulfotransferase family protein [Dokdonella immobilis]|uniref:Sulfotransferase family protein n=1 Tax=Dokdonella immobilis TaxID=578942 RepID=A0A1I4ZQM4_9GAMM|nr:sulfotransferase [Dokdonella immobilis]SFN52522.1 Sulfotransferase family protein [Dokdonella immobilis]
MNAASIAAALDRLRGVLPAAGAEALIDRLRDGTASETDWAMSGEALLRLEPPLARNFLEIAVQRIPESATLHYLLGNALRMSARPVEAEAALRQAIILDPAHANASLSLAHLLREQGRMRALAEIMTALWHHEPRTLESDRRTLAFLCECERFAEADTLLAPILEAHPGDAPLQRRAGEIALVLGRFDAARDHLRAAIDGNPGQASAWLRLAHTHRFVDADDPDLQRLRAGASRSDLGTDVETAIGFGLGKALDDLGEYGEAARILRQANARWHAAHPWDADAWKRFVDTQGAAARLQPVPASAETVPVFIVGLPRSGTTLAASLLARDPEVRARGELNWIAALAARIGAQPTVETLAAAGTFYLRHLRQDDEPARLFLDKNPLNFRHLGLIAAMLPQAKIIHCRRDLRDTALSLWSQHFAHEDMAWSYDFGDIAAFADGHARLMQRWKLQLDLPIFELDYEALVGDSEATLGQLRSFLGLDATATSSQPAAAEVFATASIWQARQGIHARSVERWRNYAGFLPELGDTRFD